MVAPSPQQLPVVVNERLTDIIYLLAGCTSVNSVSSKVESVVRKDCESNCPLTVTKYQKYM